MIHFTEFKHEKNARSHCFENVYNFIIDVHEDDRIKMSVLIRKNMECMK